MAARKRRIRKLRISALSGLLCAACFAFYLFSSLIVRTYNVSLSKKIQNNNLQISALQSENETIALEIQQLSAYDRVISIASEDNLAMYQDNIVTITNGK